MRQALTTLGELVGGLLVAIGAGLCFGLGAALIAGGLLVAFFCWLADR